jgi:hypothetical protein
MKPRTSTARKQVHGPILIPHSGQRRGYAVVLEYDPALSSFRPLGVKHADTSMYALSREAVGFINRRRSIVLRLAAAG